MEIEQPEESSEPILSREIYLTEESLAVAGLVDTLDKYLVFKPKEEE